MIGFLCAVLIYQISQNRLIDVHVLGETPDKNFVISMSIKDKSSLDGFFRHYCFLEQWAYTLIGVKPVTFSLSPQMKFSVNAFSPRNLAKIRGWKTWLKYQHYFQGSRFHIFTDREPNYPKRELLVIVDGLQFDRLIHKYDHDFQSILDLDYNRTMKLFEQAHNQSFIHDVLQDNDFLLGIILGYGRENARLFCERAQGREVFLESVWDSVDMDRMLDHWNRKKYFEYWGPSDLFYPSFASDKKSEETKSLRHMYTQAREKILQYYEGKDFLETTFHLLNQ